MSTDTPTGPPQPPGPHARLRDLEVLVGTWRLEGRDLDGTPSFTGTVTRRWLEGGHYLVQQSTVDGEAPHEGAEYIGYDHERDTLRSMLFSPEGRGPFCAYALEYVWEVEGDRLTIWHGWKDSPARFTGTVDAAAGIVDGRWEWPGGGYEATATRTGTAS